MPVLVPTVIDESPPSGVVGQLSGVQMTWQGLTLDTADGPYILDEFAGWEALPPTRTSHRDRPNSHGMFAGSVLAGGRQVVASGYCLTAAQRDALLTDLQRAMSLTPDGYGVADLSVTVAGRTLTARAQLVGFTPTVDSSWVAGVFPWVAEWLCPDPFRYGAPIVSAPTGLPVLTGGLEFDLFTDGAADVGYLDFGPAGTSGKVTLVNDGTAESRPVLTVTGTLPDGFELVETYTGRRLRYEGPVAAGGDPVTLDSATGRVRLGSADRGGSLTRAEWWGIPPDGVREVLITSLGSYSADVFLTTTHRPTFW